MSVVANADATEIAIGTGTSGRLVAGAASAPADRAVSPYTASIPRTRTGGGRVRA